MPSFLADHVTGSALLVFASLCYATALAIKIARFAWRAHGLRLCQRLILIAGLVLHSVYLVLQAREGWLMRGAPLSNWHHWCLVAAWFLAVTYFMLTLGRQRDALGLFLLPLVLGLIGTAQFFPKNQVFSTARAVRVWGLIHGGMLLAGTVVVAIGFATGVTFLVQSYQLKNAKRTAPWRWGLPSLEWLSVACERCLIWSSFLLGGGLLSGIALNLSQRGRTGEFLAWHDPAVWMSGVFLGWLVAAMTFSTLYAPARIGRKVAYLTVANFVLLAVTLGTVLFAPTEHTRDADSSDRVSDTVPQRAPPAGLRPGGAA